MITMHGKYNSANIMIDEIDSETRKQIQDFLNHPAFGSTYIAIMPDVHKGAGAVIGFTMKMNHHIIPNIIGVDIGCGMLMTKFDVPADKVDLKSLDEYIKTTIPSGFERNKTAYSNAAFTATLRSICDNIDYPLDTALHSIGTLGGGNHFIEAGADSNGKFCVTLHSGSRNFGYRVATFYQNKAKEHLEKYFVKGIQKGLEYLPIDTDDAQDYLEALRVAQDFASINRATMMGRIEEFLKVPVLRTIESVHNFIGDDCIIRKGATPARMNEDVIIPFNMRDGLALCRGKGSTKYNCSAPHGAGRILSRSQAKELIELNEYSKQMSDAGIYTTSVSKSTLDEAPDAYKSKDIILENIKETVDIVEFIKPIYNFKSGGE